MYAHLHGLEAAVYSLVGVLLGAWIAWRYQHRQWILENKKQEYRELLNGLYEASEAIIAARPNISAGVTNALLSALWKGSRLFHDRIFVARAIREARLLEDWESIRRLALWEPPEEEPEIKGRKTKYTINQIVILRNDLDEKLRAIVQRDLNL